MVSILSSLSLRDSSQDQFIDESNYGYVPTPYVCILFMVLFGVSAALHTGQAIYTRHWFMIPTVVFGCAGEIAGWAARYWSSTDLLSDSPFTMQVTLTVLSPTPVLAANFIILALIINLVGPQYSRLTPKLYGMIFITCDVVALAVQGAGGGIASSADTYAGALMGSNIMLGGIVFQVVIMLVFVTLALEFIYRSKNDLSLRPEQATQESIGFTPKIHLMLAALSINTVFLFIRGIYRVIELSGGWDGGVIRTQVWFNVFDGAMIVLAVWTYNFIHPMVLPKLGPKPEFNSIPVPMDSFEGHASQLTMNGEANVPMGEKPYHSVV